MGENPEEITCGEHGKSQPTHVCRHLRLDPVQKWYGLHPTPDNEWPDAWCGGCNAVFLEQGEWNEKNEARVPIEILCCKCYEEGKAKSVDYLPRKQERAWRSFVSECVDELKRKQEALRRDFALGLHKDWNWDQEKAELVFSSDGVPAVVAPIEFVGTISTVSDTWLWSWANFSLLDNVRGRIGAVRDLGEEQEFPRLSVPKWSADEGDGWEMAAVAAHVLNARGAYRTPDEHGFAFMVLMSAHKVQ
jgi:hypothetical protein